MSRLSLRKHWIGALALVALVGCASRSVPDAFPATSAASPEGAEAAPAPVAVALQSDPPLPGETLAGWEGLTPAGPAAASDPHAHMHHPGMAMPETPTAPAADAGVAAPTDPHAGHHHAP